MIFINTLPFTNINKNMNRDLTSLFSQDEFKKDLAKYEEMLSEGKAIYFDTEQLTNIAEYYASKDEYQKALDAIEYSLTMHPDDTDMLTLKGTLLIESGQIQKAKELVDSILETDDYNVKYLKASLHIKEKDLEAAKCMLFDMTNDEADINDDTYLDAAYLFMDNKYPSEALEWFEKALEINPHNMMAQQDYAECCFRSHQLERAILWYNKALDENPYSTECWFGLGKSYSIKGDSPKAIEALDFVLTIEPNHIMAILLKAHVYFQMGNYEESSRLFSKYIALHPNEGYAYYMIGICHYSINEFEKALKYFHKSIEIEPYPNTYTANLYQNIAICNLETGRYEAAISAIDKAIENSNEIDPELLVIKGATYLQLSQTDNASKIFLEALELGKYKEPNTYMQIAVAYHDSKNLEMSIHILEELQNKFPDYGLSYIYMSYIYLLKKDKEQFHEYFTKAMEKDPNTIDEFIEEHLVGEIDIKDFLLKYKQAYEEEKRNI